MTLFEQRVGPDDFWKSLPTQPFCDSMLPLAPGTRGQSGGASRPGDAGEFRPQKGSAVAGTAWRLTQPLLAREDRFVSDLRHFDRTSWKKNERRCSLCSAPSGGRAPQTRRLSIHCLSVA